MFDLIRRVVGDETPIVTTLDLHANISELMTSAVDVLVGYRTNPHVDMFDRGVEAASVLKNARRYATRKIYNQITTCCAIRNPVDCRKGFLMET